MKSLLSLILVGSAAWLIIKMGLDFALGIIFAILVYQFSHKLLKGQWIDFES